MRTPASILALALFILPLQAQIVPVIVYPGDTNNDSTANVYDLLPVGIAFFSETLPRPAASTNWFPQPSEGFDFASLPVSGVNFAHIDASGEGFIDSLDSETIALNYDSVATGELPPRYQPDEPVITSYCPYIRLAFDRDSAMVSDTFLLELYIDGFPVDGVPEPDGVLGAAFSLRYDPLNVKDSLTLVFADTSSQDLMFVHATATEANTARSVPLGQVDFAAAGYGENSLRQGRLLGKVQFIVEDMVLRSAAAAPFSIELLPGSLLMLNRDEQVFPIDCMEQGKDTIILFSPTSSNSSPAAEDTRWSVYPNPASQMIYLSGGKAPILIRLLDIQGQVRVEQRLWSLETPVSLSALPGGQYFMEVYCRGDRQVLPFTVWR